MSFVSRRAVLILLAAVAVSCALAGTALAGDQYEPNDSWLHPFGPVAGDVTYSGTIDTSNDEDWYRIDFLGGQQVQLTFSEASDCVVDGPHWIDYTGHDLPSGDAGSLPWTYTTPYAGISTFLRVSGNVGCAYSFRVSPASAVITSLPPAPVEANLPEANEDAAHAFGPLTSGTVYNGVIDTTNDADWMYVYAVPGQAVQFDIAALAVNDCGLYADVGRDGVDQNYVRQNTIGRDVQSPHYVRARAIADVPAGPGGRIYAHISGEGASAVGCQYQVKVGPANALSSVDTTPPATGPSPGTGPSTTGGTSQSVACARARAAFHRALKSYRRAKRLRDRGQRHKSLRALRHTLTVRRRSVTRACS